MSRQPLTVRGEAAGPHDDKALLRAALSRDKRAWREFVRRYEAPLRGVVQHAAEATLPLTSEQIEDVLGDFWLLLLEDDLRVLRAFNPARGSALLTWLTFHVASVAYEHVRRLGREPELLPLGHARNVSDPGPLPEPPLRPERQSTIEDAIRNVVQDAIATQLRDALAARTEPRATGGVDSYLCVADAARVVGVHEATIRSWINSGQLPGHRAGRHHRVKSAELERFLSSLKKPAPTDLDRRAAELANA